MSSYQFLSPEWIAAAREVRDEYADRLPATTVAIRANVVVTDAPFDDNPVTAFIDTSTGALTLDLGSLDDPHLTVKIEYDTAQRIFVGRDQSAAMEAFMTGRLVVEGDLTHLLALQGQTVDPIAEEIAERISSFTAS